MNEEKKEQLRRQVQSIVPEHEVDEYMDGLLEEAATKKHYIESVSGAPREVDAPTDEKLWPYTSVYFMPNGQVEKRDHASGEFGGPSILLHNAFLAIRVKHPRKRAELPELTVLKFRGDMGPFVQSLTKAFLELPENETTVLNKMFPGQAH